MKNWIKENIVLVIGFTLPLMLIVLFFVATVIPKMTGTPPQYEVLFSVQDYSSQNKQEYVVNFKVKDKQLMIKTKKADDKNYSNDSKKLMAYDAKTEVIREITFDDSKFSDGAEMLLEETKNMTIDTAMQAPDGYVLENQGYSGTGLIGGLFGGGSRNNGYRLKKGNVGYKINTQQNNNYYDQLNFIGWIVKK
jgi:hypothetical protein